MPIDSDVLVIGGGLAGSTAALAAATTGANVRLVSRATSTFRHASGLVDVLGYVPGSDEPVVDPFASLSALGPSHPYSIVGEAGVRDGLALFDEIVGEEYCGTHTERNALFPTYGGTVKPTARYPRSTAAGIASDDRSMLVVGFRSLTAFDGRVVADHLAATGVPFPVTGVEVPFPADFRDDAKLTRYARALDTNEPLRPATAVEATVSGQSPEVDGDRTTGVGPATGDGRGTGSKPATGDGRPNGDPVPAREALAATVTPHLGAAERVGFPALLGDDRHHAVRADLEAALGCAVFELPMGPPSLPGRRLEARIHGALADAGVHVETGVSVVGYESSRVGQNGDGERIDAVVVDRTGQRVPYHAEQFVLATGGLVGKGIRSDRGNVFEPVFDCHVQHPDDRYDWFVDDAFGDQPFARFGVVPDDGLRPLDDRGAPSFANLRAAGAVLGGAAVAAENSASGVSLATGFVAGERAGEAV